MKHLLPHSEFQLDEILFQDRNKAYGAYVLRSESDRILTKAMFVGVALFAAVAVSPMIANAFKMKEIEKPPVFVESEFIPIDEIPDVKPPEKVTPPKQIDVKTVDSQVPTPTKNPPKQSAPATIDESKDAVLGFENKAGDKPTVAYVPPVVHTVPGIGDTKPVIETPKPVSNDPVSNPDIEAKFPGGINAFRNKVVQNFDTTSFEGTGDKLSSSIVFIVEKDGTISNITAKGNDATFNKEAERTIRKIKGKWEPAKMNGQPVRSYFKMPISMLFE